MCSERLYKLFTGNENRHFFGGILKKDNFNFETFRKTLENREK